MATVKSTTNGTNGTTKPATPAAPKKKRNPELASMNRIAAILADLPSNAARQRVIGYVSALEYSHEPEATDAAKQPGLFSPGSVATLNPPTS